MFSDQGINSVKRVSKIVIRQGILAKNSKGFIKQYRTADSGQLAVNILPPLVLPFGYQHSGNLGRRVATPDFDLKSLYVVPTARTRTSSPFPDSPTSL